MIIKKRTTLSAIVDAVYDDFFVIISKATARQIKAAAASGALLWSSRLVTTDESAISISKHDASIYYPHDASAPYPLCYECGAEGPGDAMPCGVCAPEMLAALDRNAKDGTARAKLIEALSAIG